MDLLPGAPVLVDHDDERRVGLVRELRRLDDYAFGRSLMALCEIDDPPPWLRQDTAASFAFVTLHRQAYNGWEIVRRGLVREVSVLSPSVKPAEPLARVLTFHPAVPPKTRAAAAGPAHPGSVAGDVLAREWQSAAPPGVIRRVGVGRVLGVR
jgi:hypothetical protein